MSKFGNRLEIATNLAIILVCVTLGIVLVQKYLFSPSAANSRPEIQVGTQIKITDVDFSKAEKTLIVAVSETCHFCTESAPFYQKIVQETLPQNVQIVAVLPQNIAKGKEYLQKLNVAIPEIKQISLNEINVSGTPTLILLDKDGKVLNSWVGKLQPERENEIINKLKS